MKSVKIRAYIVIAVLALLALPSFAQTSSPPVGPNIDFSTVLTGFWETFNSFFSAFAPIILPIIAIPAAFAFLMFVGNLLFSAFTRLRGMTGGK